MAKIKKGNRIPNFTLTDQEGNHFSVDRSQGKYLVIYFYPKDETPGCTKEACMFRDAYEDFVDLGAQVIGISSDSPESHHAFAQRHRLPFTLLSDPDGKIRKQFGVQPNFLGLLAGRSTYIVDPQGVVQYVFNSQFNIQRHVQDALNVIREKKIMAGA